jgi:photosystem II stability/assembly factor-like uncharacterized protein
MRGELYRSTDDAESWTSLSDRIPDSRITAVATSPTNGSTTIISAFSGIFASEDYGATWRKSILRRALPFGERFSRLGLSSNGRQAFGITVDGKLFLSFDSGLSWEQQILEKPARSATFLRKENALLVGQRTSIMKIRLSDSAGENPELVVKRSCGSGKGGMHDFSVLEHEARAPLFFGI